MKSWARVALLVPALCGAGALSAAEPTWLHVQVHDGKDKDARVSVNLPLSLLDVALSSVKGEHMSGGHVRIGKDKDIDVQNLRRMWAELAKAGDTEFVTVEEKKESVRVERKGARVLIRVTDKPSAKDKVRVDVPTSVVDALLSGSGDELDLQAALRELRRSASQDFINVDDGDSRVRIWMD
jgi:hypothetical protein